MRGRRAGRDRWARLVASLVVAGVTAATALVLAAAPPAAAAPLSSRTATPAGTKPAAGTTGVLYLVLPHPDDEFETWSQVQDTPGVFKVFVLLTHGEQTRNCEPEAPGFDAEVEPAPAPLPQGRWTPSCEEARLASWRGFFTDMAVTDPTVPGTFTDRGTVRHLVSRATPLCRRDGDRDACAAKDRSARVWTDDAGRGALVVFNLGDGDLTAAEVVWALQAVHDNRPALGIDPSLPSRGVVGAYSNTLYGVGFRYDHPDHRAVAEALWGTDLRLGPRLGATAAEDPRAAVTGVVGDAALTAAFGWGGPTGAHVKRYGWLWHDEADPLTGGRVDNYQVDRTGQRRLFHRTQHFWQVGGATGA